MTDIVGITCGYDRAEIRPLGAEVTALQLGGKNLLWRPDPAIWARTSPVLFPIVGRARNGAILVDGKSYPMGIHGFAASSRFSVVEQSDDTVLLQLADNDATRAVFPFPFRLTIGHRLGPRTLTISFKAENPGAISLPYALGLHPGFVWPFSAGAREDYRIEFEKDERAEVPRITSDGLLSEQRKPVPLRGRLLQLTDRLFDNDALCFLNASSGSLRFVAPDGSAIRMEVENFPHFALWTRPGAPFLCLEAWTGYGDLDGFAGDIREKPSMRFLAPGATAVHAVRLTCEAPA